MRRRTLTSLLALGLLLALALVAPAASSAQEEPATDEPPTAVPTPHIIPRPNTGVAPTEAGDRGGALQLLLPVLIVVAIGGAVFHLTRQSRRARAG